MLTVYELGNQTIGLYYAHCTRLYSFTTSRPACERVTARSLITPRHLTIYIQRLAHHYQYLILFVRQYFITSLPLHPLSILHFLSLQTYSMHTLMLASKPIQLTRSCLEYKLYSMPSASWYFCKFYWRRYYLCWRKANQYI